MKKKLQFVLTVAFVFMCNVMLNAQALNFDGENDFVNCGNDASLTTFTNNQITIEAWVNASAWKDEVWQGCVITKDQQNVTSDAGDDGYMLRIGKNGILNFNIGGFEGTSGWNEINTEEGTLSLNTWHHIAGVYDGTSMIIYVDGIEVVKEDKEITIGVAPDYPLVIGDSPQWPGRYFPGMIDEVRIWNVARTAAQIYGNKGKELTEGDAGAGLIAYYKLNDGSGTDAKDQTGANNGILGGAADSVDYQPAWIVDGAPVTAAEDWVSINMSKHELFGLGDCYPNPSSAVTIVPFELKQSGNITISLYDVLGKEAKLVINEQRQIGVHEIAFNVSDLNTGLYLVKLSVDGVNIESSKLYVK